MKIVFFSNFFNHHQMSLCNEFIKRLGEENFKFIACEPIPQERLGMGYEDMNKKYPYIVRAYESKKNFKYAEKLAETADVMIFGSGTKLFLEKRLCRGGLTFFYSERLFKKGSYRRFIPRTRKKIEELFLNYKSRDDFYVLCASAYTSYDLSLCGFPENKCYKWGYFPKIIQYENIDNLMDCKKKNSILWAGRLIDWKHPELALYIAEKLASEGYEFTMNIIGTGNMLPFIKKQITAKKLENYVTILGAMSPDKVRNHMEESEIFLFTSDKNEGWGAVLNESMNSGCAVVASNAIGSVPFMLNDGINGLIYDDGDKKQLLIKVKKLINEVEMRKNISKQAYYTVREQWCAENAATRLIELSTNILTGNIHISFENGVCSKAEIVRENTI